MTESPRERDARLRRLAEELGDAEVRDGTVVHSPPNTIKRIDALWVFVSEDATGEGVCAYMIGDTVVPMVAADERRLEQLVPAAQKLATLQGRRIKLLKLTAREEVRVIEPGGRA
jgi:hypothetical protein